MAQGMDFNSAYAWPTWSPDGTKLAASRIRLSGDHDAEVTVQVLDAATGRAKTVFSNDFPGLVAEGSPHYLYWCPDSKTLSLLASTPDGLSLFIVNTESDSRPVVIERGAPLYYSCAGDGNSLTAHIGEEVKLYRELSDHASGEVLATTLGFRVPAFSSDSQRLAYAVQTVSGGSLMVAQVDDLDGAQQVLDLGASSAFIWSPDGRELAVADQGDASSVVFERLRVVSADGSSVRTITQDPFLAFYWSPNGEQIAWVGLDRERRMFEWKVAPSSATDASQGRLLFSFNPSRDVLTMLTFFDQYAYSHSPWSPDSTHLVVAGTRVAPFERRNGHTPTGARVFVLDAAGGSPPQEIAEGTLAFWSWN
jgi:TolB protein